MNEDLSTIQARLQLGNKYAVKYDLDTALVCAVADHESGGWNPWAIRYEPAFYERYIQPMLDNKTLHDLTEATARSISWGLMQIMGQTAREQGYTGHLAAICDPDTGLDLGCQKLKKCIDATTSVNEALLRYNGGSNPAYPQLVLSLLPKYQPN